MNTQKSEKSLLTEQESETRLLADQELSAVTGGERAIVAHVFLSFKSAAGRSPCMHADATLRTAKRRCNSTRIPADGQYWDRRQRFTDPVNATGLLPH
jgi:hypothetical protein